MGLRICIFVLNLIDNARNYPIGLFLRSFALVGLSQFTPNTITNKLNTNDINFWKIEKCSEEVPSLEIGLLAILLGHLSWLAWFQFTPAPFSALVPLFHYTQM